MKKPGIIALDLDGTLLNSQKRLSERNRNALLAWAKAGAQIVPTTGRAASGIIDDVRRLPGVNFAITTNGGVVADLRSGKDLLRCTLDNALTLRILEMASHYHAMYDPYVNGRGISQPKFMDHLDEYKLSPVVQELVRMTRDTVPDSMEWLRANGKDAEKVNIYFSDPQEREAMRRELESIPEVIVSSSMDNNLEVNAKGATKGNALLWLADYLHIDRDATVSFGDGDNDISMLKMAGRGIAMANAAANVKAAADEVTLTNDEDGVGAALERLMKEAGI